MRRRQQPGASLPAAHLQVGEALRCVGGCCRAAWLLLLLHTCITSIFTLCSSKHVADDTVRRGDKGTQRKQLSCNAQSCSPGMGSTLTSLTLQEAPSNLELSFPLLTPIPTPTLHASPAVLNDDTKYEAQCVCQTLCVSGVP